MIIIIVIIIIDFIVTSFHLAVALLSGIESVIMSAGYIIITKIRVHNHLTSFMPVLLKKNSYGTSSNSSDFHLVLNGTSNSSLFS